MGTPQIIWLVLNTLGLGIVLCKHGEYRREKNNFWVSLAALIIEVVLLKWGGFFG